MQRKAIQLAHKTLVISIPAGWAREHGITKGSPLSLETRGSMLTISQGMQDTEKKTTVKIAKAERFFRRVIDTPYRLGYEIGRAHV